MESVEQPKKKELPAGTLEDFVKIDIRIGEIIECWKHPESDSLYCEKINLGDEVREIGSGLQKNVKIEEMKGLVCVMANLKPRKLAGFESNGMILCAGNADHTAFNILRPPPESKIGERVTLEEFDKITQDKAAVMNPKHKILEKCLPLMKTDDDLYATFNGKRWITSAGYVTAQTLKNANIS